MVAVAGAIIIAVILVIVLPVLFLLGGTILAIVLGWLLYDHAEAIHPGSELIETNI
jgi:hypothetical protein